MVAQITEVEGDFQIYRGGVIYHQVHFSNFFPTGDANERSPGWISGVLGQGVDVTEQLPSAETQTTIYTDAELRNTVK